MKSFSIDDWEEMERRMKRVETRLRELWRAVDRQAPGKGQAEFGFALEGE